MGMKYVVSRGTSPEKLQEEVQMGIDHGWEPIGGASVSMSILWKKGPVSSQGEYEYVQEERAEVYCQAMVKMS